jgi:hypothetical protein
MIIIAVYLVFLYQEQQIIVYMFYHNLIGNLIVHKYYQKVHHF